MTIHLERGHKGKRGDGARGDWIVSWQSFLAGRGIYVGDYSPNFGPKTEAATERFQESVCIRPDGEVGDKTTEAARALGFDPPWSLTWVDVVYTGDTEEGHGDPSFPQPEDADNDGRADLVYLKESERQALWGPLEWGAIDGKPVIANDWYAQNIVEVHVPQLVGVDCYGSPSSGDVRFHKKAAAQLLGAFQAVEGAGLLHLVLTYGGTYNFRFIRGSTKTLSNHGFGVAIDLNMKWNGLGKRPALVGEEGSLRQLVKIFERFGAFWGGWYRSRRDGQHSEFVEVIPTAELEAMVRELSTFEHILPWLKDVV